MVNTWGQFSIDMPEQAMMTKVVLVLGMTSWCVGHVVGNQDNELDAKLYRRELGPRVEARSRRMIWPSVETSQLELQTIDRACMSDVCGWTNLDSAWVVFGGRNPKVRRSY